MADPNRVGAAGEAVAGAVTKPFASLFGKPAAPAAAAKPAAAPSGGDADWVSLAGQARQAAAWLGQNMPSPDDPAYAEDAEQFSVDFMVWQEMFGSAVDSARNLSEFAMGYQTLPDGTIVGLDQMDPEMRAAAEAENTNRFRAMQNALGLQAAKLEDDRSQARFNNEVTLVDQAMKRDDLGLRQAESKIDRALAGRQESRQRAELVSDVKRQAAPYTTRGGKTSFSAADLGAGVGSLAQFVGVDPGASLLNYGSTMLDPEGDMGRFDEGMGVAGLLAEIPELASLLTGAPAAPSFGSGSGLQGYVDPATAYPRSRAGAAGNAVTGGAKGSLAAALGFGRGPGDELPAALQRVLGWGGGIAKQEQTGAGGRPLWQDPVGWAVDQYSQAAGLR